jgi:hypothetical protein
VLAKKAASHRTPRLRFHDRSVFEINFVNHRGNEKQIDKLSDKTQAARKQPDYATHRFVGIKAMNTANTYET